MKTQLLKKFFSFIIMMMIFFNLASAQNYFMKTFEIGERAAYSKVVVTADHHYMALGTLDTLLNPNGILLSKYDTDGNVMWTRVYEEGSYIGGSDIVQTSDGGFAITASQRQFIRIDSLGDVLYANTYGSQGGTFPIMLPSADHGYFLGGSYGGEAQIIRVDSSGQVIWSKKRNNTSSYYSDLTFTPDAGLIAIGFESGFPIDRMIVSSFDTLGNFLWEKRITPGSFDDTYYPSSIVCLSNGGYAIAGSIFESSGNADFFILKIDDNGNLLNQWRYGSEEWFDNAGPLLELDDGSLLIGGGANLGTSVAHQVPFVMQIDSMGDIITGSYYSQSYGDTSTWGLTAALVADSNELLLAGLVVYPDTLLPYSFSANAFLFKTSMTGEGLCSGEAFSISFITDDLVVSDNSPQLGNGGSTPATLTITSTLYNNQPVDFCLSTGILNYAEGRIALNAFPNPFSNSTIISYSLSQSQNLSLKIFDLQGRLICTLADEVMSAGPYSISWDARDENRNAVSTGIYFLKMQTVNDSKTILLSLVK